MHRWPEFKTGDIIGFLGYRYMVLEITSYDYILYDFTHDNKVKETISRVDTYYELEA